MTGWMPDYTATFFADFAFKGKGFDSYREAIEFMASKIADK